MPRLNTTPILVIFIISSALAISTIITKEKDTKNKARIGDLPDIDLPMLRMKDGEFLIR